MSHAQHTPPPSTYKGSLVIFEDEEHMCRVLSKFLNMEGYHVTTFVNPRQGLEYVAQYPPDIVITDIRMPELDGFEVLKRVRALDPRIVVLIITAYATIDGAVDAMREGAFHYIQKPFSLNELLAHVDKAIEQKRLLEENIAHKQVQEFQSQDVGIVGESAAIRGIKDLIAKVAATDSAVLITGESGTGKELVARALHKSSPRALKPFVAINCASIPENLLESELFGYEKGAFTGADKTKLGLIEVANSGVLFLDEIGDLPLLLQAKILRVLQEKEIQRVGSTTTRRVDIRLIAATNQDLSDAIEAGTFREDLYYRLNVIRIHIPPLRERREDIPPLVHHFMERIAARYARPTPRLTDAAMQKLIEYPWHGNVRELVNVIERMMILRESDTIGEQDLPPDIANPRVRPGAHAAANTAEPGAAPTAAADSSPLDYRSAKAAFEREYIVALLRETAGNIVMAARIAGISRRHLYEKIERYQIDASEFRDS
ncbi:MAG: sigma-54 dependent transcriptional regulator [Candidatus Sumerlaeia bacterium]